MMAEEPVLDLPGQAIQYYRDEYRDLAEAWRNLDLKAQGLTVIAGIFLGAVLAWLRQPPVVLGSLGTLLIEATVLLLGASFLGAFLSLLAKPTRTAPGGEVVARFSQDFQFVAEGDKAAVLRAFQQDLFDRWKRANEEMLVLLCKKGEHLQCAQLSLLFAAIAVAVLAFGAGLHPGGAFP